MTDHQADVVIVGGGIVGCAAAYYLAKRGASVILLERNGIGSGASGRSGGGVRQSARATAEMPLANEAVALFPALSDELGVDIEYVQRGNLRLVESVDHIRPMQVDVTRQQSIGLDVRWAGQVEVCEVVPSLRRENVFGASFCPTDGHANPLKLTTGHAAALSIHVWRRQRRSVLPPDPARQCSLRRRDGDARRGRDHDDEKSAVGRWAYRPPRPGPRRRQSGADVGRPRS